MAKKHCNTVVVGAGLSGLLTAHRLKQNKIETLIVEAHDLPGGFYRDENLQVLPATEHAQEAVGFLKELELLNLETKKKTFEFKTFEKGSFQTFVGFGSRAPEFVDELDYYLVPEKIQLSSSPKQWIQSLSSQLSEQIMVNTRASKILLQSGKVTGIEINGKETIACENVVFSGHPDEIARLLPVASLKKRTTQQLAKSTYWTAACIDFTYNEPVENSEDFYILMGGTPSSIPSVGYFSTPQQSHWLTFVEGEESENHEKTGPALREAKKQIRRAFGDLSEHTLTETIRILPQSHGRTRLQLEDKLQIPEINGLWVIGSYYGPERNLIASVLSAQVVSEKNIALNNAVC